MPRSIPSPQRPEFLSSRYYGNVHAIKQSGCLATLIKKCTRLYMSCNYISHTKHPSKSYVHAGRALPAEKQNSLYSCEKKREICVLHGDPGAGNLGRQKTSQEAAYHIELTLVLLFSVYEACKIWQLRKNANEKQHTRKPHLWSR